jgi:hypothetical protein
MMTRSPVPRTFFLLALCMQLACGTARAPGGRYKEGTCPQRESALCSSYQSSVTNMFLALGRGDLPTAMYHLSLLTGVSVSQQQSLINGLTHFFDEGNQVAGRCGEVARGGFQSLSRLGDRVDMRPYFLKIISTDGPFLGFETRGGVTKQVSDNGVHVAVKFAGRIFDAYTGPGGMEEQEYFKHIHTLLGQNISKKEYHSFPGLFSRLE